MSGYSGVPLSLNKIRENDDTHRKEEMFSVIYRLEKNAFRVEEFARQNNLFLFPYHPETGSRPVLISCKLGFLMVESRKIQGISSAKENHARQVYFHELDEPIQQESDKDHFEMKIADAYARWNLDIYSHLGSVEADPAARMIASFTGGFGFALVIGFLSFWVCNGAGWNPLASVPIGGAVFPFSCFIIYEALYTKLTKKKKSLWRFVYKNSLEPSHGFNERFFRYCMKQTCLEVYELKDPELERRRRQHEKLGADAFENPNFSDTARRLGEKFLKRKAKKKEDKEAALSQADLDHFDEIHPPMGTTDLSASPEIDSRPPEDQPDPAVEELRQARAAIRRKIESDYKSINRSKNTLTKYLWYTDPLIKTVEKLQDLAKRIISSLDDNEQRIDIAAKFASIDQSNTNTSLQNLVNTFTSGISHTEMTEAKHKTADYLEQSEAAYQRELDNILKIKPATSNNEESSDSPGNPFPAPEQAPKKD